MRYHLSLAAIAMTFAVLPVRADDCGTLMTAMLAQTQKPYSATITMQDPGGPSKTTNVIFTGSMFYTQIDRQWHGMAMTGKEQADLIREASKTAKTTCQRGADEMVNGEMATIYNAHVENRGSISDNKVWVSKSRGLALKSDVNIKNGPHMTSAFDYSHATAPAGAK